jgi:hypothetical protein
MGSLGSLTVLLPPQVSEDIAPATQASSGGALSWLLGVPTLAVSGGPNQVLLRSCTPGSFKNYNPRHNNYGSGSLRGQQIHALEKIKNIPFRFIELDRFKGPSPGS